jgi:hypothetical protein
VHTARNRLAEAQTTFSLECDSNFIPNRSSESKKINVHISDDSVRLETSLEVDFWEVDPNWDGKIFKSAAQATRHTRSGELPLELKIKIGRSREACIRLVTVQGKEFQLNIQAVSHTANRL